MNQNTPKVVKKVSKYNIFEVEIGYGSSGKVFLGSSLETSKLVAVKIFEKSKLQCVHKIIREQTIKNIQREASIHKQLNHNNIVKLYDVFETKNSIYFFLEYCQLNLEQYLKQETNYLSEQKVRDIFLSILHSFIYLKDVDFTIDADLEITFGAAQNGGKFKGLCHRDLKPSNILLFNDQVKLGDFGLCRDLMVSNQTIGLGTTLYMSPLSLQGKESTDLQKNDVWAAGIILYEMLYKHHPWKPITSKSFNMAQLNHNLMNDDLVLPDFPKYSSNIKSLLRNILLIDETKRLSWQQILEHPWIDSDLTIDDSLKPIIDSLESLDLGNEKNPKILKMHDIRAIQVFYKDLHQEIDLLSCDLVEMKMLKAHILSKEMDEHNRMRTYYDTRVFKHLNWYNISQIKMINHILLSSQAEVIDLKKIYDIKVNEISTILNKQQQDDKTYTDKDIEHSIGILVKCVRPGEKNSQILFLEKLQFLQKNCNRMNKLTYLDVEKFLKKKSPIIKQ